MKAVGIEVPSTKIFTIFADLQTKVLKAYPKAHNHLYVHNNEISLCAHLEAEAGGYQPIVTAKQLFMDKWFFDAHDDQVEMVDTALKKGLE